MVSRSSSYTSCTVQKCFHRFSFCERQGFCILQWNLCWDWSSFKIKKSIHLHCSLCPCRSCSRDHSFFWSKIKIFVYTTPLPPGFQISIPEVELQHSMPSTCASHLCATSSPHSFGVTGLTPNCKFLALNISSCGETLPLPYKSMLSLQVDTNPFLWLSSASFLAFILW